MIGGLGFELQISANRSTFNIPSNNPHVVKA